MADYQSYKQINGGAAITANSLGPAQVSGFSTAVTCQFFVCNSDYWTHANGGCCLYWTVPGKALTVRFELTAGGGSGSISACCHNGPGGGGGAYAVKTQFAHKGEFTSGSTAYLYVLLVLVSALVVDLTQVVVAVVEEGVHHMLMVVL